MRLERLILLIWLNQTTLNLTKSDWLIEDTRLDQGYKPPSKAISGHIFVILY